MWFDQASYDVRFEWGVAAIDALAPVTDAFVIVDVLSFSTCVDVATAAGVVVIPVAAEDDGALELARRLGAELAGQRGAARFTLSPAAMRGAPRGTRVVLPSRNGGAACVRAHDHPTFTGCLRNARAVAAAAAAVGHRISVIAAGERWPAGELRPCLEDLLGAGAIVTALPGRRSPEAKMASHAFASVRSQLLEVLRECASGHELLERGDAADVTIAAEFDVSGCAPRLEEGAFVDDAASNAG